LFIFLYAQQSKVTKTKNAYFKNYLCICRRKAETHMVPRQILRSFVVLSSQAISFHVVQYTLECVTSTLAQKQAQGNFCSRHFCPLVPSVLACSFTHLPGAPGPTGDKKKISCLHCCAAGRGPHHPLSNRQDDSPVLSKVWGWGGCCPPLVG
jgi:hypothetical protein